MSNSKIETIDKKIERKKLEPWRGDYDELCNLVNKSWIHSYNNKSTFLYSKDFLQWYIENSVTNKKHQFAYYNDNELIAFCSCINRKYKYNNIIIPGVFSTFSSIHPDYMRKRYYFTMICDIIKFYREEYRQKNDPALFCFYSDQVQPTYQLFTKAGKETGIAFETICRVNLRAKVFDTTQLEQIDDIKFYEKIILNLLKGIKSYDKRYDDQIKPYNKNHLEACYELTNKSVDKQTFAPYFNREELNHYLSFENFSKTLVFTESRKAKGFISYRFIDIFGKNNIKKIALIDWISEQQLNREERKALVMRCLLDAKKAGCITVMFPDLPFLKNSSLNSGGFLSYPRDTYLCCYNFDPDKYNFENLKNAYEVLS